MATLTADRLTVVEQAKRINPDGTEAKVAELLDQFNEVFIDAVAEPANDVRSHKVSVRDGLPTISPRKINAGGTRSVSKVNQKRYELMLYDVPIEIDEELIDHEPSPIEARRLEEIAFMEATLQEFARVLFYGNESTYEDEINGLATLYNTLSDTNVRGASGTGSDTTSVWIVQWKQRQMSLIYPKGSKGAGIEHNDKGKLRITDTSGNPYYGYCSQVKLNFGIAPVDARAIQRIANIESDGVTNNLGDDTGQRNLFGALNSLPSPRTNKMAKTVLYCNRDVLTQFDIWANEKSNMCLTVKDLKTGEPMTVVRGCPVRMVEQILSTETAIS